MNERSAYSGLRDRLKASPERWLVTGAAGFIGSALVEALLALGQQVVGLDNFATGRRANLEDVRARVGTGAWAGFTLIEGDIADPDACRAACAGATRVLHQAALGSVPRSLADPWSSHRANVDGFMQVLIAAKEAGVARLVYASSSSVYGDHPDLPKVEGRIGTPLSPYAATKLIDEIYADVFHRCYSLPVIGMRYFNVFGRRQDPDGAYAAVIPRWIAGLLAGTPATIYGDGETSRDFCYIENVVQANLLAATSAAAGILGRSYNIACGGRMTLRELYGLIRAGLPGIPAALRVAEPISAPFRAGDVRHSQADISAAAAFGYVPSHSAEEGLRETLAWYAQRLGGDAKAAQ